MRTGAVVRGLLGGALAFIAVWLFAIGFWRSTAATPTTPQIIACLLVAPLLLIGTLVLVLRLIRRRWTHPDDGAALPITAAAADATPDHVLYLLASAVLTRAGNSGAAVAQALRQPQRPPLHPVLRDRMGLPVFAAEVGAIDVDHVRAAVAGLLPDAPRHSPAFGEEQLRVLALLDPVAEELLYAALPTPVGVNDAAAPEAVGLHPHAMQHSRSSRATAPAVSTAVLHIRLLLPASWPEPVRRACVVWLGDKAAGIGFAERRCRIEVEAVTGVADVWRALGRLADADGLASAGNADTHLWLAAHSLVHETAVDRLDAARALLISGHPEGLIPGEGAAGLLLATCLPTSAAARLCLHRVVHAPAGQGRGAARALAEVLQRALDVKATPGGLIGAVFSDADHRPSRAIEIAGAMTACLPELDLVEHARHLGLACGETGAVAALAALAAASAQAAAGDVPVLVVSVADREMRFAALLSPVPDPESSVAAAAGNA